MPHRDELLDRLCHHNEHPLRAPLGRWLAASRRFRAFATSHETKIRKKLRLSHDDASVGDLHLELETAYLLLSQPLLSVVYEPEHGQGARSADFSVMFTTSHTFMLEVTRLRPQSARSRIAPAICQKLGQLSNQRANVIIIGMDGDTVTADEPGASLKRLLTRIEQDDTALRERYGFRDRSAFFAQYRRLSLVIVRSTPLDSKTQLWENPLARYPLPISTQMALQRSHEREASP